MSEIRQASEMNPWMFQHESGFVEVCKDSGLLMAWEIVGLDADGSSEDDIVSMLDGLDSAYKQLTPFPITLQWIVHRRRVNDYPEAHFQDKFSERIDENRKHAFVNGNNFVNRHYLVMRLEAATGGAKVAERVKFFLSEGNSLIPAILKAGTSIFSDNHAFAYSKNELNNQVKRFIGISDSFTQIVMNLGFRQLGGEYLTGFLRRCFNPNSNQEQVISLSSGQYFSDDRIPDTSIEESGNGMLRFVSGKTSYATGFSFKEVPDMTIQGALDMVLTLPFELTIAHSFKFADRDEATKHCQSVRRFNMYTAYSPKSYIMGALKGGDMSTVPANQAKLQAAEEANEAMGEISVNRAFYGNHNFTMLVYGKSEEEAESNGADAKATLNYNGFTPIEEKMHLLSAYSATVPGMMSDVKRWHFLEIKNLSDVTPFLTIATGGKSNPYLSQQTGRYCPSLALLQTQYGIPYYFNFHTGDIGHTFVIGPTRSGKSVGMNFFISQWQKYYPCQTYIFDKDFSCRIPTLMQGGTHIDLTSSLGGSIKMNPMSLLDDEANFQWVAQFVESLILSRSKDTKLSSEDSKSVWEAVLGTAKLNPSMYRLLSILPLLPKHLRAELEQWTEGHRYGNYFDNVEDNFSLGNFTCIEMGEVMSQPLLAHPFMDYAFYRIKKQLEKNRSQTPVPTMIYIEECWFMLDDERFSYKVRDWLKTLGKLTAHVVMATQSPEDLAQSTIFASLRDNIPTRIFLPNAKAGNESLRELYTNQFQLNDSQLKDIIEGVTKRDYLITQPGLSRIVRMTIDRDSLAVLRSDSLAQTTFDKHLKSGRADWKINYIEEMRNAF